MREPISAPETPPVEAVSQAAEQIRAELESEQAVGERSRRRSRRGAGRGRRGQRAGPPRKRLSKELSSKRKPLLSQSKLSKPPSREMGSRTCPGDEAGEVAEADEAAVDRRRRQQTTRPSQTITKLLLSHP